MKRDFVSIMLLTLFVSAFSLFLSIRAAQSESEAESEETGLKIAGFQWGGAIELGYRFTDIDGSRNRYKETVNLMEGFRLFELSLWGKNLDEKKGLVDYFSLNTTGIGDPFPYGRLEIKKNKVYDFVATYREYKYFSERGDTGSPLTDFPFNFNQKSTLGTIGLSVFPKDDVKLNFGYRRYERDGDAFVPRVFLIPDQKQDLNERLNEYFVSADFPIANWDFHVKQDYWNFQSSNKLEGPQQFEKPDSRVNTYVSTIKAHTKFGERWDLDTGYIFAYSEGRADLLTSPNPFVSSGDSKFNFYTNVFELGLSYLLMPSLIAHFDYRFHTLNQDGRANTDPFLGAPANVNTDFNLMAHTGTLQLEYIPKENLTLRAGVRFQYRDINGDNFVVNRFDGGKHPNDTEIFAFGWVASASWKPFKFLSLFGEYQGANFNNPYTWISPENENIAKVKIKYDTPIEKLNLIGTFSWRRRVNPDQEYRVDAQDYTITATYQPAFLPKLSLDGSFTYEKIQNSKNITNEFPSPAFTRFSFDSDALIYTAGISYEGIYKGLGARVNGSYAKTTKENPQRYADFVLSLWYKNRYVTPILTFERTYLHDHLVRAESFDANLITLSLRKEF